MLHILCEHLPATYRHLRVKSCKSILLDVLERKKLIEIYTHFNVYDLDKYRFKVILDFSIYARFVTHAGRKYLPLPARKNIII